MTAEERTIELANKKAQELLSEFSKEKALDIAETMLEFDVEFKKDSPIFWENVINSLNKQP